jgi:hypothetical protein
MWRQAEVLMERTTCRCLTRCLHRSKVKYGSRARGRKSSHMHCIACIAREEEVGRRPLTVFYRRYTVLPGCSHAPRGIRSLPPYEVR